MKIGKTSAKAIIESVKSINYLLSYSQQDITEEKIINLLNMSERYAKESIEASVLLGFVINDPKYELTKAGQDICSSSADQLWIIFRNRIIEFPPFTPLLRLFLEYNNLNDAIMKVIKIYEIKGNVNDILYSIKGWLKFSRIIDSKGKYIGESIDFSLPSDYISEIKEAIRNKINLRIFLENFLSTSIFSKLPSRFVDLIIGSFQIYQKKPDLAIVNMGKALECYIRNLPSMLNVSYNFKQNATLGALVSDLKNNSNIFLLDNKHIKLLQGIIQPRNMSAHEPDNPHWDIKEESTLATILFYLSVIRSIHLLIFTSKRIF